MAERIAFELNGETRTVEVAPDTPLLYVLRNELGLSNPHFGCGLAQCGACTVHLDGQPVRSCVTPLSLLKSVQQIVTLEGLGSSEKPHPVKAFIDEQAVQCSYRIPAAVSNAVFDAVGVRLRSVPSRRRR